MKQQIAKTVARVERERERESYNLENKKTILNQGEKCSQNLTKKILTTNRGITIVVLLIIIIIMLILLGVGTKVAVDGKLFDTAQNAVGKTNDRVAQQQSQVNNLSQELDEVIQSQCKHEWKIKTIIKEPTCSEVGERIVGCSICGKEKNETITKLPHNFIKERCRVCNDELKIGILIRGYDPAVGENGEVISESYTSPKGTSETTEYGIKYTGNGAMNQTFTVPEEGKLTKWRVARQDSQNRICITTAETIHTDEGKKYKLQGAAGYANFKEELDKICSIYGRGKYAESGRSITYHDQSGREELTINYSKVYTKNASDSCIYLDGNKCDFTELYYYDEQAKVWKELALGESVTFNIYSYPNGRTWSSKDLEGNKIENFWDYRNFLAFANSDSAILYYINTSGGYFYMGNSRNINSLQGSGECSVRPVVCLKTSVKLIYDDLENEYIIVE